MTEKKLYQFAYNWAVHIWYKLDLYLRKNPESEYLKDEEKRLYENIMQIEQEAKEKGYTL